MKFQECPGSENHVGGVMHRTSHEIRRALDARITARLGPELTGMWGLVLGYIQHHTECGEDVCQRDVESRFHIRRSSVTAMLQGMERAGLLTRCPVAQDARLKKLLLTPAGQAARHQINEIIDEFERELQQGIPPEEIAALRATLIKLAGNLSRLEGGAETPSSPADAPERKGK